MKLVNFLNDLFKEDGFKLIDANKREYLIGKPKKKNPIILELLDSSMHYKLLLLPELYLGEGYMDGKIKLHNGTITEFLEMTLKNLGKHHPNNFSKVLNKILGTYRYLTNFNFAKQSKKNVAHHYDISEKLYDLFLDEKRQYSCAYFKNENDSLEEAQNNKINHIIKKLNIKDNQTVLDIGSGWGGMAIEIAKKTKARILGITLSENQLKYSRQKAKEMNLENQVEFKLIDYRELKSKFDRIVSVGMFEHVGKKFYRKYFKCVYDLLNENGAALIHTIGSIDRPRDPQPWISKYIFPGGYTPSLSEIARPIEDSNLVLNDLEVLRLHYAHTLRN